MSDDKKGFTVKDRRLFTPEGELRGAEDDAPAPASPPTISAPHPSERPERAPGPTDAGGGVDFASFLMSLAAQAGSLLEGESPTELEGARQMISILEMLADKTTGRRTPERLLYELRLAYVERARAARA
jgi:hypothetical protein